MPEIIQLRLLRLKMNTLIDLFGSFKKRNSEVFVYRTGIRRFTFSYSDLYNSSLKMAQYLRKEGIKEGDKVAIWAPNSPYWAFSYFGILLTGAIVVPIDFASGKKRAETILKLSGAKFIIQSNYKFEKIKLRHLADGGIKTAIIENLTYLTKSVTSIKKTPQIKSRPKADQPLAETDMCEIVYTSGTTGDPKGVVLTHKNIVSNILSACNHISLPSASHVRRGASRRINFLSVLPLSHMLEQTVGFLTPLYRGDKIIYVRTIKPSAIMQSFTEENIAAMLVVPRFLSLLKNTIEREFSAKGLIGFSNIKITRKIISYFVHKKFGANFQMFISGGAALPLDVFVFWKDLGFKIIEGYGLTECSPIVSANSFESQIPGSVGQPLTGVKVKLDNNELLVKGENVFSSYYENPKETEQAFANDWFRTGDFAKLDHNGNIFIKGRKKDVIVKASGINIYPEEIEAILNRIKDVKDSAVLGLDIGEGEQVHAVLLLKGENADPSEIIRVANEKLDLLSQIEGFSVWEDYDFPRTTTLKIQKFKVKEKILQKNKEKVKSNFEKDTLISLLANVSKKSEQEIKESSLLTSDLGLNSLSRLELINFLEEEYRVDLQDSVINQNTTVADLRKILEKREKTKGQRGLWLWTNKKLGIKVREVLDFICHIPLSFLFFDLEVKGISNLRNIKKPVIFVSNHVSYLDQPAIMRALPRNLRYTTATAVREEFFFSEKGTSLVQKILFPYAMIAFNAFLLPQKSGFRKSLSFMGKLIDHNINILIFPEGSRTKDGKLGPFMQGLGILVKELQVSIVPVRIIGMEKIYPRGTKFPKRGKCTVIFGKPLEFTTEIPGEIVEISRKAILNLTY